jgi:hypothetical protein
MVCPGVCSGDISPNARRRAAITRALRSRDVGDRPTALLAAGVTASIVWGAGDRRRLSHGSGSLEPQPLMGEPGRLWCGDGDARGCPSRRASGSGCVAAWAWRRARVGCVLSERDEAVCDMHATAKHSTRWFAAVEDAHAGFVFRRMASGRARPRRSACACASTSPARNAAAHAIHPACGEPEPRG